MKHCYQNLNLDEERALYAICDAQVTDCRFEGPADGESALKECRNIAVSNCDFLLRYPLWHVENCMLTNCRMTDTCRAAMWYDRQLSITSSTIGGIKALRECCDVSIKNSQAVSTEFGWKCNRVNIDQFTLASEYPFLMANQMEISNFHLQGKYSFQYVKDVVIRNSVLDTKDAFWHAENVTVYDSVIKGEYLAWYSKNLHLVRCKIIGTQPFCYCDDLILEDCTTEGCDLAFENSNVHATIIGDILSVKNPVHGSITADRIKEKILDSFRPSEADCMIVERFAE